MIATIFVATFVGNSQDNMVEELPSAEQRRLLHLGLEVDWESENHDNVRLISNIKLMVLVEKTPSQARYAIGEIDGKDDRLHALDWNGLAYLTIVID